MSTELFGKLSQLVDGVDVEGLRLLAWHELKRDGVLTGDKTDIELMMREMKEIMRIRFEEAITKQVGQMVLRQIRKNAGAGLLEWVMKKHAEAYISAMASDLEHVDLGVAG